MKCSAKCHLVAFERVIVKGSSGNDLVLHIEIHECAAKVNIGSAFRHRIGELDAAVRKAIADTMPESVTVVARHMGRGIHYSLSGASLDEWAERTRSRMAS
ncbi:MAG: hypothetical protein ABIA47_00280 [bacterium]